MLQLGMRGVLVLGLLTALACSDRGRGTDRNSGRTGLTELNNEIGEDDEDGETNSSGDADGGASSPDDPPITVTGDGDVGYQAYQRWLTTEEGLIGPVCDCAVSFGAYSTVSECQSTVTAGREDVCVSNFTRSHAEGSAIFFDCLNGASTRFGTCLNSRTCYDQSDYDYCVDAYNKEFESCGASLSTVEANALRACSNA